MNIKVRTEDAIARGRIRTIVLARWVGAAFGLFQVLAYRTFAYPPGVKEFALGIVAAMAASNVGFELARRRTTTPQGVRYLALAILTTDVLLVSGLTWVYAFDSVSAIFAILFLLPIEGAVLFGFGGAMWTWVAVTILYIGREFLGTTYGDPFEFESVTFRTGLFGIVAIIVGLLVRDLVEQRQATAEALRAAQRADESRSRLVSMLAHDVRAPIAGVRAAFDTLHSGGDRLTGDQRERVIDGGRRQADRALLLARDLLDLAKVEEGKLTVELVDVRLAELVESLEPSLGERAPTEVDVDDLVIRADRARMEQVLFNLLDNAGKHGRAPVVLSARRDGEAVEVTVRDHGPGVPEAVEVFTAFSHAGEGSTGLGLWIVRHLVEAMGGTATYEDADPGAAFVLRFPAGGDTAAPDGTQAATSSSRASGTTSPVSRS